MNIQILMAAHQRESRLAMALEGVRRLIIPNDVQLSVLVCDDGSPNSLEKLCKNFGAEIVRTSENLGTPSARRNLIANATGDWCWFLDSDMYVHPEALLGYLRHMPQRGASLVGESRYLHEIDADRVVRTSPDTRLQFISGATKDSRHDWPSYERLHKPWEWAWTGNMMLWGDDLRRFPLIFSLKGWGHDDTALVAIMYGEGINFYPCPNAVAWHVQTVTGRVGNQGMDFNVTKDANEIIVNGYIEEAKRKRWKN